MTVPTPPRNVSSAGRTRRMAVLRSGESPWSRCRLLVCAAGLGPNGTVAPAVERDVLVVAGRTRWRRGEAARSRAPRNPDPREADGPSRLVMPWPRRSLRVPRRPGAGRSRPRAVRRGHPPRRRQTVTDLVRARCRRPRRRSALGRSAASHSRRWMRPGWLGWGYTAFRTTVSSVRFHSLISRPDRGRTAQGRCGVGRASSAPARAGGRVAGKYRPPDTCIVLERVADRDARGDAHGDCPPVGCLQRGGGDAGSQGPKGPDRIRAACGGGVCPRSRWKQRP